MVAWMFEEYLRVAVQHRYGKQEDEKIESLTFLHLAEI